MHTPISPSPAPLAPGGAAVSLAVLAPYLPYGITVEWRGHTGVRFDGVLVSLNQNTARVKDYKYGVHLVECRPVLRPFSALCDPLPDGTVPAVEVAKLAFFVPDYLDQQEFDWQAAFCAVDDDDEGREHLSVRVPEVGRCDLASYLYLWTNGDVHTHNAPHSNQLAIIDYLRSQHFAVGLEPHQYIAKAPAAPSPGRGDGKEVAGEGA